MNRTATTTTDDENQEFYRLNSSSDTKTIHLIWCDACLANDTSDAQCTKEMLAGLCSSSKFFSDTDQCIAHLESIENDERVILGVSGLYASIVLPVIHRRRALAFVFIFCMSRDKYMSLLSQYDKIVDIYVEYVSLQSAICKKIDLLEKQAVQFIVFSQEQKSTRDLTEKTMDSFLFIFHSVLLDILKRMPSDECAKEHLVDTCAKYYCDSKRDLMMIERFRTTFKPEDAIKWYTTNCFLFRLLNKALRTEDIELLFAFRFYIITLYDALKNEKRKLPLNTTFKLFRGQKLTMIEIDLLRNRVGRFITTNSFLSTSFDADVSLMFAGYDASCPESLGIVLFEIQVNSSIESAVFAPIEDESNFIDEKEVLFSLTTTFKIDSMNFDEKRMLWTVQMTATDDGSRYVDEILEIATVEEKKLYTALTFYGHVIWYEFQQIDIAERYFQTLIKTLSIDHPDLSMIHYELGCIYNTKKQSCPASKSLVRARDLLFVSEKEQSEQLAMVYHAIGETYGAQEDLDKALNSFQRALCLWNLGPEHARKARTIEWIGRIHELKNGKDDENIILNNYNQALNIYQKILPSHNDQITECLQRIGHFYDTIGQFDNGLVHYKRATFSKLFEYCEDFNMFLCDLNPLVSKLKERIVNFGPEKTQDQAFLHLNEVLIHRIHTLHEDENHPNIAAIIESMGDVCEDTQLLAKTAYYEIALCKYELHVDSGKALHSMLQCVNKLCSTYEEAEDYSNAMIWLERMLAIQQKCLSPDRIDIVQTWIRIGKLCKQMECTNPTALHCFEQALVLYQSFDRKDNTRYLESYLIHFIFLERLVVFEGFPEWTTEQTE